VLAVPIGISQNSPLLREIAGGPDGRGLERPCESAERLSWTVCHRAAGSSNGSGFGRFRDGRFVANALMRRGLGAIRTVFRLIMVLVLLRCHWCGRLHLSEGICPAHRWTGPGLGEYRHLRRALWTCSVFAMR